MVGCTYELISIDLNYLSGRVASR